jgi:CheY-like chemotaxis protein
VRSAPGQGSTFLALFPFSGPTQRPAAATVPGAAEQAGAGRKVLVVDDEQVVLRTTRVALERYGYTVLQADSGPAGIELLKREKDRLSLVLLDLSMPGMNGQQTLAEMRKITPSLDVIVLSGYSEAESREVFAGHAISGFIQKPYRPAELVQLVNSVRTARVPRPAD